MFLKADKKLQKIWNSDLEHIARYSTYRGGTASVMVIIIRNGHDELSSNP